MDVHTQNPRYLKFAFDSWATKVLTCKTSDKKIKAYGVEAIQGEYLNPVSSKYKGKGKGIDRVRRWYAKKEVILSAGPFETPKLLMVCSLDVVAASLSHSNPLPPAALWYRRP